MKITFPKAVALQILVENHAEHTKEYNQQVKGWKKAIKEWAKETAKWADGPADPKECPRMPYRPSDYRNDYRTLIRMIESHDSPTLELDERDYQKVILNNFEWREQFISTSILYYGKAE